MVKQTQLVSGVMVRGCPGHSNHGITEVLILGEVRRMGSANLTPWASGGQNVLLERLGSSQKDIDALESLQRKAGEGSGA